MRKLDVVSLTKILKKVRHLRLMASQLQTSRLREAFARIPAPPAALERAPTASKAKRASWVPKAPKAHWKPLPVPPPQETFMPWNVWKKRKAAEEDYESWGPRWGKGK